MDFSQTDHINVIPLQEIAELQARLLPEQNSPSISSDENWTDSGNSSPSRNDLSFANHEYDEDQPLRPVYSPYFELNHNLTVCWVYSKVVSMTVTINSDSSLQEGTKQQQHNHGGIRYSFKQYLNVKIGKHNDQGTMMDFAHPSLLYARKNGKQAEMTFPLVDILKPTNKVKLSFYLAHTCSKENCSTFSIWLAVEGTCPHCKETCNLITPQQVTNNFLTKSKTTQQIRQRTKKNKKSSGSGSSAGEEPSALPALPQSTFSFTLGDFGEIAEIVPEKAFGASEDTLSVPWLHEKEPLPPLQNDRYKIAHNLTGIWANYKAVSLQVSTLSGVVETLRLKVRKILRNGQSSGFCDDSILYKRKKSAKLPVEPFSVNGTPQMMTFYFSTTCHKASCEYFALSLQVQGPTGPADEIRITNVFTVKSKSQEQNQKRIERETAEKRKQQDESEEDKTQTKKQKLQQEEITQLMQTDDLSASASSPDLPTVPYSGPPVAHCSPVSSPHGSDHNSPTFMEDLDTDLSDTAHLVPLWVMRPANSSRPSLDIPIDISKSDDPLPNSQWWDGSELDFTNPELFDLSQYDLAALFPDLPNSLDIPSQTKQSEEVTYPHLYTPQTYSQSFPQSFPQSYPQVSYPSIPNSTSTGWTPSSTYTSSFSSAAPKSCLYPTLDTPSTNSTIPTHSPSYNMNMPSLSIPSLPSTKLTSAASVVPSVLATLSMMAFKPFFGSSSSSSTPSITAAPHHIEPIPMEPEQTNTHIPANNNQDEKDLLQASAPFPDRYSQTELSEAFHPLVHTIPQHIDVMDAEVIEMGPDPMNTSDSPPLLNTPNNKRDESDPLQATAPPPDDTEMFMRPHMLDLDPMNTSDNLQPAITNQPIPFTTPTYASSPTNTPWSLPMVPLQQMPPYAAPVAPATAPAKPNVSREESFVILGKLFLLRILVLATMLGSVIVQLAIRPPRAKLGGLISVFFVLADAFTTILLTRHTKKSKSLKHLKISARWLFMCSIISFPLAFIAYAATHHYSDFILFAVAFFQFSNAAHLRRFRKRMQQEWIMGEETFPLVGEMS